MSVARGFESFKSIMKIIAFNWNNILTDVIEELRKRGHELLPLDGTDKTFKKADVVVSWNETGLGGGREVVERAKKLGKRTVLVQHGRRGTSRIYPPFNETLVSDVACVWSENDKQRLISVGVPPEKIVVTGTSIWKHLKPREAHEGINVVFSPEHWDHDVAENFIVADELRKLKKVNIITKVLANTNMTEMYDNPVVSDRNSPDHLSIVADVLSTADVVVAVCESTFELLAQAMNIPVVIADIWVPKACDGDERYKEYHREYSNACVRASFKDLNKEIMKAINHPELLVEERHETATKDGGIDIADPVKNIISVIENA